jgi:hypothetical protein
MWHQEKMGCVAVADIMSPSSSVNPTTPLPPPPPPAKEEDKLMTLKEAGVKLPQE